MKEDIKKAEIKDEEYVGARAYDPAKDEMSDLDRLLMDHDENYDEN
jgi:hypothetical protein